METPKALTGVYVGDLDIMGNQLKAWQYEYLWDYTNDEYFSKIRYAAEMRWQPPKGFEWDGAAPGGWNLSSRGPCRLLLSLVVSVGGGDVLSQDACKHGYLG